MRVFITTPYDLAVPGGVNRQARGLLDALTAVGVEARLAGPASAEWEDDDPRVRVLGRVSVKPMNGALSRLSWDPAVAWALQRELAVFKPQVLHVQEPVVPLVGPLALMLAPAGCVTVGQFHTYSETSRGYLWSWPWCQAIWSGLEVRVAVSGAAREFATRYHRARFGLIPNAIELADYAGALPQARPDLRRVLFVGRMDEPRKGIDVLLAAWPQVDPASRRGVVCRAIGRGGETWAVTAERAGVQLGQEVDDETLRQELAEADVVVVPSRGGESFGLVGLEAMAAGAVVIAADIAGHRGWMRDAAEWFQPGDATDLARALTVVMESMPRRQHLLDRAQSVVQRYAWAAVAERWLSLYRSRTALAGRPIG